MPIQSYGHGTRTLFSEQTSWMRSTHLVDENRGLGLTQPGRRRHAHPELWAWHPNLIFLSSISNNVGTLSYRHRTKTYL